VFGRATTAGQGPLASAVDDMIRSSEPSLRALGWNLRVDHRVSEKRGEHFFLATGQPSNSSAVVRALVDYHREWVCAKPRESYLSPALNGQNVDREPRSGGLFLAHVLNVSAWVRRLREVTRLGGELEFAHRELDRLALSGADLDYFVSRLLEGINGYRDQRPIWVARWTYFAKMIDVVHGATWNAAVGMWRRQGTWQIVLRYSAEDVGALIRPTQLDAGDYQFHFPSPPNHEPLNGGVTLALRHLPFRAPLLHEWIHAPFDFRLNHWIAGGRLCARVDDSSAAADQLILYRARHRERLVARYPQDLPWMPDE
jgi:hypothetical protein